ncbi:peptide ligase PGM1-related protein [Streptomyces sp. WAC06614]|uniref:preATP grasp domain-containing protein n=1 Tax=Streptomyces sp. WAC06614 TaxID=2487416 RepID=UPI000F7A28B3|nr:peptide ligase PGM1-related protein [Streptomyces sp. WAC06614]RSS80797.1 ATP-grasp domain-containing protein [Streptomyces sp. WAC06614]
MSTLVIGNAYNEHLVGDLGALTPERRDALGNISLRLAWLLEPGDVLVVPQPVTPAFLHHLLDLKGLSADEVTVLVPPPGRFGDGILTGDRLLDPGFVERLRPVLAENAVDTVLPYAFDSAVAELARLLGLDKGTPGFGFLEEGGTDLLNSKCAFRAIAAGRGLPMAEGVATGDRAVAQGFAARMLAGGRPVIVKQDHHAGGYGNDILAPHPGVDPIGASRAVLLQDPAAVARHFDTHWAAYTGGGRHPVVVERYHPDSVPLTAELEIHDDGVDLHHVAMMRMRPVLDGIAISPACQTEEQRTAFADGARDLCVPVRAMGYRGLINIDVILTPDGEMLFSEFNGRLGGTTHLHHIGTRFLGSDYATRSTMLTRNSWRVGSMEQARAYLAERGLAFDPATGHGVLVTCDSTRRCGTVEYCIVADDPDTARATERALALATA